MLLTVGCSMRGRAMLAVWLAASSANFLARLSRAQERPPPPPGDGEAPPDPCTIAAQAVFEPCCPLPGGAPGDPTACLYTSMTYAEMCSDVACTEALSTADRACAGETAATEPVAQASQQAYQTLRAALSCQGLDDQCVETVQDTMTNTCQLSPDVLLASAAQLQAVAAQDNVCSSDCTSAMQDQLATCGAALDVGTQLILQLFASLLGTCGALAQPGTICSEEEMSEIQALCTDPATSLPSCSQACVTEVVDKVGRCPLSFTDPGMATLASTCGTNTAMASTMPCPPDQIPDLLSLSEDCDDFNAALASSNPCADMATNQELAQAVAACSVSAALPPCDPAVVDQLLGVLPDCQEFAAQLSAQVCNPTDERLQAAGQQCGNILTPPAEPGADGNPLGALGVLNTNCPATEGDFQRACW